MSTGFTTLPDGRRQTDKDPSDELRYWADVSGQMATGDTIATVGATVDGLTLVGSPSFSGGVIQFKISGGQVGVVSSVTLEWTTTGGDTLQRSLYFNIKDL